MKIFWGIILTGLLLVNLPAYANIELPALVGSHMVLQQNSTINVWGKATPGEKVEVTASWNNTTQQTIAKSDSTWLVQLQTTEAGGPYSITFKGENFIVLNDVLLGEVWLCSGQSNMEFPFREYGNTTIFNLEEELKNANYPPIRLFHVPRKKTASIQTNVAGQWVTCSSKSMYESQFSAVGYFFARRLFKELNIPVGMIDATWGGTRIEAWTPLEGFKMIPSLDSVYQLAKRVNEKMDKHNPTLLYNGMIAPLTNFTLKGCIWYQGESNLMDVNNGLAYEDRMKALIGGWRKMWQNEEMPFYYVQIAPYRYFKDRPDRVKSPNELPLIWEAQTNSLSIPNTGMVVTTDLVNDLSDIHPRNKQDVGLRLANLALNKTYGKRKIICDSPQFRSLAIKKNKAIVTFSNVAKGLETKSGEKELTFFTIAGEDKKFVPATAILKGNKVVVFSDKVEHPAAVRFAWDEEAQPNLFNSAGLPAIPFRTDNW